MPIEVIMPKVDMDMASGRIAAWHAGPGESVRKGEPLFDIETDKAAMEVESPASGTLQYVAAETGQDVPIGHTIAWIYAEDEDIGPAPAVGVVPDIANEVSKAGDVAVEPAQITVSPDAAADERLAVSGKVRATPLARRLARENGADLASVQGSGHRGRIVAADLDAATVRQTEPSDDPSAESVLPPAAEPAPGSGHAGAGTLSVIRSGKGDGAPLVLIHGIASDGQSWAKLEALLPRDRPVFKIELPNHGRSPRRGIASFQDIVRDVRDTFDTLDLANAGLIGHSLGGAVALAIADCRRKRIGALTLISPAGLGPDIDTSILTGIARAARAESLAPWLKMLTADPDAISPNYVKAVMMTRADAGLRRAQLDMADAIFPDGTQSMNLLPALDRLDMPARIVWGRADRVIPWRHALRAPGHISLNLFESAGHLPHLEQAEQVARLLKTT